MGGSGCRGPVGGLPSGESSLSVSSGSSWTGRAMAKASLGAVFISLSLDGQFDTSYRRRNTG